MSQAEKSSVACAIGTWLAVTVAVVSILLSCKWRCKHQHSSSNLDIQPIVEALKDSRLDIGPIMEVLKEQKVIEERKSMILEKIENVIY